MTDVDIVATGPGLVRNGVRGIEPVVEELVAEAQKELQILAYLFTPKAVSILDLVSKAAERGVTVSVMINSLRSQAPIVRKKLRHMASTLPHARLVTLDDPKRQLHAKVLIADREKALVGSANFSWGGMVGNYEVGVLIEGEEVWKLAGVLDSLARKGTPVG